jgi:hypothetical protein
MTRKKYTPDDVIDFPSSSSESESEDEEEYYDEDVAWQNVSNFLNEHGKPNWLKYICPTYMFESILDAATDKKTYTHLMLKSETEEDMNILREYIDDMVNMCGFVADNDHIESLLFSLLDERSKYLIVGH